MERFFRQLAVAVVAFLLLPLSVHAADSLKLCTGSPGKTYYAVGQKLADVVSRMAAGQLEVEIVATQGSIDNLTRMTQGECDAAIVQGDAIEFFASHVQQQTKDRFQRITPLYKELSLLICSRESGVGEIEELPDMENATVAAGAMGSGSLATWLTFASIQTKYKSIKVLAENGAAGALAVAQGKATCLFEVIAPQSDFIDSLNANEQIGGKLMFAEVDDGFAGYEIDGQPIYTLVEFDDEKYPNISTWGDPELIAITAYLVVDKEWAQNHSGAMSTLSMSVLTGQSEIESVAYGDEKPFEE